MGEPAEGARAEGTAVQRWRRRGLVRWSALRRTTPGRLLDNAIRAIVQIEILDRSMTLAAQAFTSIVPIMLVAATLRPHRPGVGSTIIDALALPPAARDALSKSIPPTATISSSVGLFGIVVAIVSATSFSRALERIYLRVWGVHKADLRSWWRWFATLLAVVLASGFVAVTRRVTAGEAWLGWVPFVVQLVAWTALWSFVPWVLLQRAVRGRPLVVAGGVTAVLLALLTIAGAVYLPLALTRGIEDFGLLGMVFVYISWLWAIAVVVVGASVVVRVCADDDSALGALVRGPAPVGQWRTVDDEPATGTGA